MIFYIFHTLEILWNGFLDLSGLIYISRTLSTISKIGPSVLRAPAEQTKVATVLGN